MAALKTIVKRQVISYDFDWFPLEYHTNLPVLVFSEGASLLPCMVAIKMQADPESVENINPVFDAAKHFLLPRLDKLRTYLTLVRHAEYDLSEQMQTRVQNDFASLRQKDSKFVVQDFHRLLILARLISLSQGERKMSLKTWRSAIEMEKQRVAR